MSCCVPGCKTSYWNKETKNVSLFHACTDRQLRDWAEILRKKVGLEKFNKTNRICMLHFKDDVIEREKTRFVRGGKIFKEKRKKPILSDFADPSIFSENPKCKQKKNIDFCITLGPEVFAQQRIILQNRKRTIDTTVYKCDEKNKKIQFKKQIDENCKSVKNANMKLKTGMKRKIEIIKEIDTEDVMTSKLMKSNNFYEDIVNAINDKENISKHLNKLWIANINNSDCVSWTLWSEDYSKCLKNIVLHKDLKVNVYVNEKPIFLAEMNNIKGMFEFENLLKTVKDIMPCMKLNDVT